ncbi:hypothetical protein E1B28_008370 [Marasmius oreades]|uniref:Uncharacterized protein n=1 Tax=Marasmius oreades TaxID=181124 RepID=A0A9P7URP5_9AGAR|nr:uncharacterized protein E1B28_008370 [Marasmius oreades]KAG7091982.1 hypothetical protein E1B28_008370 [Marasmius oreades]
MRPTPLTLLQILPRAVLDKKAQAMVIPSLSELAKAKAAAKKTEQSRTVVDELLSRKARMATTGAVTEDQWPINLRVERVVKKEDLKHVHADVRKRMKQLVLKET